MLRTCRGELHFKTEGITCSYFQYLSFLAGLDKGEARYYGWWTVKFCQRGNSANFFRYG